MEEETLAQYASKVRVAHQTSAAKDEVLLTFASLKSPRKNAQQRAALTAMLDECVAFVAVLVRANSIVLPGSQNDAHIDFNHWVFSIRNGRGHVYYAPELDKIGSCGNGQYRWNKYNGNEKDDPFTESEPLEIRSVVDLDNLTEDVQKELIPRMLKAMSQFVPATFPTTINDLLELDQRGLPVFTQLLFWSMVKDRVECKRLGGAIGLQSCLRRLTLSFVESGAQAYLAREEQLPLDQRTCQHESLNSNALGFALSMDADVTKHVRQLFDAFEQLGISRDRLLKEEHILPHLVLSWPPGKTKRCPPESISVQVLMASLISPHFLDTFSEPPIAKADTLDECYDTRNYTQQQVGCI